MMPRRRTTLLALGFVLAAFGVLYRGVIVKLVHDWANDDNYSHGFLIVPIALYLAWERRGRLASLVARPSMVGVLVVLASVAALAAGVLGAELFVMRVSMLGVLAGAILFLFGWGWLRVLAFPLAFLLLMIPIPAIVFNQVAFPLQLLASKFGELALNIAGVPVLREGNVITLSNTTLEVAEACSGIRSLVSLLTLAIVYGYFVERRTWARVALALASIPVAIIANGVRVAGTGIAAHYWGPDAAQGFFHTFSGWLVFIVAFILLFAVQRVIALIRRRPRAESEHEIRLKPDPTKAELGTRNSDLGWIRPSIVALILLSCAVFLARAARSEVVPARESFATFPMQIGAWEGHSADRFDQRILTVLGVDEYVSRTYTAAGQNPVGLYLGFYGSQRQGDTMHSPLNCLPGAGWEPAQRDRVPLTVRTSPAPGAPSRTVMVNRILIQRGLDRQLVLYWYQSHGRVVPSEYWGKIYTVVDAIRLNRTDAAMVRVISPVAGADPASVEAGSRAATEFVQAMFPLLGRYLPD